MELIMGKLFEGIRYEKKILCPKCLVQPESIYNYGTDQKGFWFKGRCPHCNNTIIWYRNVDLSFGEASTAVGEQLSMYSDSRGNLIYKGEKG